MTLIYLKSGRGKAWTGHVMPKPVPARCTMMKPRPPGATRGASLDNAAGGRREESAHFHT